MVEPARPNRDIALCRYPISSGPVAAIQSRFVGASWHKVIAVQRGPTRFACGSALVADPSNIGTGVAEDARFRLQLANELHRVLPTVIGLAVNGAFFSRSTVKAVAAVCSIEKDFEDLSVVGQELAQLVPEVSEIGVTPVVATIAVPGR